MAWEDIGIADPRAMQIANDAASTYERLGSPEGDLALASEIVYLSVAPKSNAAYQAYSKAKAFVQKDRSREVPLHLRNASNTMAKKMSYGQNLPYAHDEPYGYAAGVSYWPDDLTAQIWYRPVSRGLEIKISEKLKFLKQLDAKSPL
jgi:putative ATPase